MRHSSQSTLRSRLPPPETIRRREQTEGPEHFQGGYEPPPSDPMEGGGRQGDRQPQEARRLRAGTCILRPCWTKVVGSRLFNKLKVVDLFKSRLVVLGWAQVPGIDYGGTFAPVCRLESIRMMVAIAAELDYEVLMLDVQTAFLNADVEKEVYVKMAPGYETYDKSGVPFVMNSRRVSTVFDRALRTDSAPWTIISQTPASARSSRIRASTCSKTRPALPS